VPPPEVGPDLKRVSEVVENLDTLFSIGQLNVKDSMSRVHDLKRFLKKAAGSKLDIIALQDIPKGFAWASFDGYHTEYCSSRALTQDDKPKSGKPKSGKPKSGKPKSGKPKSGTEQPGTEQPGTGKPEGSTREWQIDRVAFLVRNSILLSHWDVTFHTDEFNGLAATLRLETPSGSIRIHNVYNRNKELDMTELFSYCPISHSDILLGDFNLHHPAWGGDNLPVVERSAKELHKLSVSCGTTCQTPRGAVTYSRSESEDKHSSTIDLTFTGVNITTRVNSCQVIDIEGFGSDHRLVVTELKIALYTEVKSRYAWNSVNRKEFLAAIEDALSALGFPPLTSVSDIDDYLERFIGAMTAALQKAVPIRQQGVRRCKGTGATHEELLAARAKALEKLRAGPNPKWEGYWRRKRISSLTDRRTRRTLWRRFIAKDAERFVRGRHKIFQ
jgi:hypothetical protein